MSGPAKVRKNARAELRVELRQRQGGTVAEIRQYEFDGRDLVETPKGITISPKLLDPLIEALQLKADEARKRGLI